jgi:hypothetical protein
LRFLWLAVGSSVVIPCLACLAGEASESHVRWLQRLRFKAGASEC